MSGINAEIIDYLKLEKQVRLDGLEMMDKSAEIPQRLLKEVSIFDRWIEHLANGVTTVEKQCNLPVVNACTLIDSLGNEVVVSENMTDEQWNTALKHHMVWLTNAAQEAADELEQHWR